MAGEKTEEEKTANSVPYLSQEISGLLLFGLTTTLAKHHHQPNLLRTSVSTILEARQTDPREISWETNKG